MVIDGRQIYFSLTGNHPKRGFGKPSFGEQLLGGVETFEDLSTLDALRKQVDGTWRFDDIILDAPLTIDVPGSGPYSPTNYSNEFYGEVTLTEALARSFGVPGERGALLNRVLPGGPAYRAGLLAGDIVTAVGDRPVSSSKELRDAVAAFRPGSPVMPPPGWLPAPHR